MDSLFSIITGDNPSCFEYNAAISHYKASLQINPHDVDVHNNLGNALLSLGDYGGAAFHYREALLIDPDNVNARNNLEDVLTKTRDSDQGSSN